MSRGVCLSSSHLHNKSKHSIFSPGPGRIYILYRFGHGLSSLGQALDVCAHVISDLDHYTLVFFVLINAIWCDLID